MQSKKNQARAVTAPMVKPMVKELAKRQKLEWKTSMPAPSVDSKPLKPAALYQDAGNGYTGDFTFPQR